VAPGASPGDPEVKASVAPEFGGRYRLVITTDPTCPAAVRVGPLTVLMDVLERTVSAGSEVSGLPARAGETPKDGRFVFLRQTDALHGASGAEARDERLGLTTQEGYRIWMQLMADGTAAASGSRSRASGTAFGEIDLNRPGDVDVDAIGYCIALNHTWSLEPE
jgi:hypothetical protein